LDNLKSEDLSYYRVVLNHQVAHSKVKVEGYLKDVKSLCDGNTLSKMSEFEAAKIIGLGTIVGKYQQKALALKNVNKKEFLEIKDEFITSVKKYREAEVNPEP
jgi:hypothetical protein